MPNIKIKTKKPDHYLLLAIPLITLAVFSQVVWHDFVNFDDPVIVYSNPNIQSGVTFDAIRWAFTSGYESNWIPLTWISHMLDVQLFGMNPAGHHGVNVLFHAASSILLFLFLSRATKAPLKSASVAFLFALHPLHVESVAWVAERKDVLSAFFWMLTMYAYVLYSEKPGIVRYAAVLGLFVLGLLSKPMLVTLPVVLLLLDWWPLGRLASEAGGNHLSPRLRPMRLFVEKIPFFLLSAGSSIITYSVQQSAGEIVTDYSFMERASRACVSYIQYIDKMIWPSKLAVFYPFSEPPPSSAIIIFSVIVLLLITGAVFWMRKRLPFLITGWFWYIVALLPVIGLVQIGQHSIADRYSYIPLIGLFVMMAWGIPQFLKKLEIDDAVVGIILGGILVMMISLTWNQLQHWKNSFTLLTHAIEVTENNWLAQNNLGLLFLYEGKVDEAILLFNDSLRAKPSYVLALLNLGAAHSMRNEPAQAVAAFRRVLQFEPESEKAHVSLGLLYLDMGEKDLVLSEYRALQASGSPFASYLLNEINARAGVAPMR